MLEQEIRRRIYRKLESVEDNISMDIESLCEYRAVIREVLMLYYYDHREDLKNEK